MRNDIVKRTILFLVVMIFISGCVPLKDRNSIKYSVQNFNKLSNNNIYSFYNDGNYYYYSNSAIYRLVNNRNVEKIFDIPGLTSFAVTDKYVFYTTYKVIAKYDYIDKTNYIIDTGEQFDKLELFNDNVFYRKGDVNEYDLYSMNVFDNEYVNVSDYVSEKVADSDDEYSLVAINGYKYFYSSALNSSRCTAIMDLNNNIFYKETGELAVTPVHISELKIILADNDNHKIDIYKGYEKNKFSINFDENEKFSDTNVYYDDDCVFILLQYDEDAPDVLGAYNLPQSRHKSDSVVKINKDNKIDEIYRTSDKNERIVAFQNNAIYLFQKDKLYKIKVGDNEKREIAKLNIVPQKANFEVCEDRLFVWENGEMIFTIEL